MPDSSENQFNFEEWSTLASRDPEKFEQLRQDKIAEFIGKTDRARQKRLLGLQWQIDRTRDQHKESSTAACLAISKLMWQTFEQLSELLQSQAKNRLSQIPVPEPAKIIPFPNKNID